MEQGLDEIRRTIREQEPQTPSMFLKTMADETRATVAQHRQSDPAKLTKLIRGDLDWIVMKALEKERTRRYETANDFSRDIQRHLENEPVLARPPSQLYRFQRMVQRNKLAFAAGVVVAAALLVALVVLVNSRARITRERNQKDVALQQRGAALTDAQEQLFLALLNQARAGRISRQMGQRLDSLDALEKAARIRPDERLRDEAIAAMALPDVRPGPHWRLDPAEWFDLSCRLAAGADAEGVITVFSLPDRREIQRIASGHKTWKILFSGDGRFLAQFDANSELRIWRVADGHSVFGDELGKCACLAFSRDNGFLAVGKNDEIVRYDLASGSEINRWRTSGTVHVLSFHPRGHLLAVGSAVVSIYHVEGQRIADLPVGVSGSREVAWHPDGIRLAVSGAGNSIQIWNTPAMRKVATLDGQVMQTSELRFHPNGELLVSKGWDAASRVWDTASGRPVLKVPRNVWAGAFSTDGQWLGAVADATGGQLLEVATCPEYRTIVSSLGADAGGFFDGDISPDGRLLTMGMRDGVRIWNLASGREDVSITIERVNSAFFQRDGRELITCGGDGLQRWPIEDRTDASQPVRLRSPQKIPLPFKNPTRACRSRDGRIFAVTSEWGAGGGAYILDATTDAVRSALLPHPRANFVALSPDGKWVATAGFAAPELRLWNVQTGKMAGERKLANPHHLSFTADSRAVVGLYAEECCLWDVRTLQPIRRLRLEGSSYISPAAFSQDEKMMALEVTPGVIHLTDMATGRTVAKLTDPFGDRATWMSFTPDGTQLVAASTYSMTIHIWDLRRIRARLKTMGLDWDWPEFPPGGR